MQERVEGERSAADVALLRVGPPQPPLVRRLSRTSGVGALVVSATGLVVLLGWAFQVDVLTRVSPGLATMKVNTAASLTSIGVALYLSIPRGTRRARPAVAATLAGLVGLLAGLTMLEYATGSSFGFDNPFGLDPGDESTSFPGRMSLATALSLALLAGAVLTISRNAVRLGQVFATMALTVGAMAMLGYIYSVDSLYQVSPFTTMAIHTATAVVVASLTALAVRAGEGYVGLLTGNTAAGVIVRWLLPVVTILPAAGGAVTLWGMRRGLYDAEFAFAMSVTLTAAAGAVVLWVAGARLRLVDLRRVGAEDALTAVREASRARDQMAVALAQAERHARQIISTASDAYIAMDTAGRVTDWNQAATNVFGWSRDQAVGELLERLIIPPEVAHRHRDGLARYRETGEAPILGQARELPARRQDDHRLVVELTAWSTDATSSQGFHAFVRDITDRKLAEEELRQANEDLSGFAALVAHDLRTPLIVIQGFADLILSVTAAGTADPSVSDFAQRIRTSAERAAALIDDILAFASVGRDALEDLPVDLNSLVRRAGDEVMSINRRSATIDIQELPTVSGDASLLEQLFSNLLGNALKYVPADRVARVTVDTTSDPEHGDPVIRVTDNGEGIGVEDRERVFSMFQRGDETGDIAGTGVGLAICRKVVERHNGRIWIETAPEGGTRFCVSLSSATQRAVQA